MTSPSTCSPTPSIADAAHIGTVTLTVANLAQSLDFYTNDIGFRVLEQAAGRATLGVGQTPMLYLHEQPDAAPWPRGLQSYTGLFHVSLLLPTRADLSRWLQHWLSRGHLIPGQGDHLVNEAFYIEDPDSHGIEISCDRPVESWIWHNGEVQLTIDQVDIANLLREADGKKQPWAGLPAGTTLGHIHLQVGEIVPAERFYSELLGFAVMARFPSVLFMATGGYHHHIGVNIWHSEHAGPAPPESVNIQEFTIVLPTAADRDAVVSRLAAASYPHQAAPNGDILLADPWGVQVRLTVA